MSAEKAETSVLELVPVTLVLTEERDPLFMAVTPETRDQLIAQYIDTENEAFYTGTHYDSGLERRFAIHFDLIDYII